MLVNVDLVFTSHAPSQVESRRVFSMSRGSSVEGVSYWRVKGVG